MQYYKGNLAKWAKNCIVWSHQKWVIYIMSPDNWLTSLRTPLHLWLCFENHVRQSGMQRQPACFFDHKSQMLSPWKRGRGHSFNFSQPNKRQLHRSHSFSFAINQVQLHRNQSLHNGMLPDPSEAVSWDYLNFRKPLLALSMRASLLDHTFTHTYIHMSF